MKHQFTHLTWKIKVYAVSGAINIETLPDDMIWFDLSDRDQYTFPTDVKIYQFYKWVHSMIGNIIGKHSDINFKKYK